MRIKSIEYYENGTVKKIEYYDTFPLAAPPVWSNQPGPIPPFEYYCDTKTNHVIK